MNCNICFDIFKDPRILICGHTFCYKCIIRLSNLKCPICRKTFRIEYCTPNYALCSMIEEKLKTLSQMSNKCANCHNNAFVWCDDCVPLCSLCKSCNKEIHKLEDHKICSLDKKIAQKKVSVLKKLNQELILLK